MRTLQVKVRAQDQGSPPQQGTAGVIVTVKRNKHRPEFATTKPYEETVAETFTPSLTVIRLTATDADPQVREGTRTDKRVHASNIQT